MDLITKTRVYKRCSSLSWYSAFLSRLLHSLVVHWSSASARRRGEGRYWSRAFEAGSWVAALWSSHRSRVACQGGDVVMLGQDMWGRRGDVEIFMDRRSRRSWSDESIVAGVDSSRMKPEVRFRRHIQFLRSVIRR